jgi:hypothetical protein
MLAVIVHLGGLLPLAPVVVRIDHIEVIHSVLQIFVRLRVAIEDNFFEAGKFQERINVEYVITVRYFLNKGHMYGHKLNSNRFEISYEIAGPGDVIYSTGRRIIDVKYVIEMDDWLPFSLLDREASLVAEHHSFPISPFSVSLKSTSHV